MACFRLRHFRSVLLDEGCPLRRCFRCLTQLDGFYTRGEGRKPYVVPVLRGKLCLGYAAWRAAYRSNSDTFAFGSGAPKSDNSYGHRYFLPGTIKLLLSISRVKCPTQGFCTKLSYGINHVRGSFEVHQHCKTVVSTLEGILRIRKLEVAVTPRDQRILHLDHDLILVLDSDISPQGFPIVSQSHPESNSLP